MPNEMTPMKAWSIIYANLMDLYKRRRDEHFKGYLDADIEAEVICFMALKEMEERIKSEGRRTE